MKRVSGEQAWPRAEEWSGERTGNHIGQPVGGQIPYTRSSPKHAPALAQQRGDLAPQAQAEVAEVGGQRGALAQPHHKPDGGDEQNLRGRVWRGGSS